MTGVIAAAGRGTRAYPHTRYIPKAMIDVCGQPLMHYTLSLMRDQLAIRDVVVVVSELGAAIREHFGDGESSGMRIRYVPNARVELGLTHSVRVAREHIQGSHFVLMLSDELYWNSNHCALLKTSYETASATVVFREHATRREIRKNFSVDADGDCVRQLVEKPADTVDGKQGCGTYVLSTEIFDVLDGRFRDDPSSAGDLTGAINSLARQGRPVRAFALQSEYVNINYPEDIQQARAIIRRARLPDARLSLVIPVEADAPSIEDLLKLARRQQRISELVLVARKENADLSRHAAVYGARVVVSQGLETNAYGGLFRAGIEAASGDIVALATDDDSFDWGDLDKLLAYICEADLVLGSRTTSQLIQQGSNLHWTARWANWLLAKIIVLLWFRAGVRLTDAGCTFRGFWRDTWKQLSPVVCSNGPEFSPEMIVEALRRRMRVLEIPINYCRATEESCVRLAHRHAGVFFTMLAMIVRRRLGSQP